MKLILKQILDDPSFQEGLAWHRRYFSEKDVIVKEGEDGATLFYIETGSVRVSGRVLLENNKSVQPGFCDLVEGQIFGEICLHEIHKRTASVTAVTASSLIEINGAELNAYFDAHPEQGFYFYQQLFSVMIERMKNANQRVENLLAWGLKVHEIEQYLS
jgi:CRP/FNR family transcriptional regulator, cyclic AMP receptor protein